MTLICAWGYWGLFLIMPYHCLVSGYFSILCVMAANNTIWIPADPYCSVSLDWNQTITYLVLPSLLAAFKHACCAYLNVTLDILNKTISILFPLSSHCILQYTDRYHLLNSPIILVAPWLLSTTLKKNSQTSNLWHGSNAGLNQLILWENTLFKLILGFIYWFSILLP